MDKRADGSIALAREELYALVWETPLSRIAQTMGTIPTHVAWACDKYQVPRPRVGHWSKLKSGNRPAQPPLPAVEDEDLKTVIVHPSGSSLSAASAEPDQEAEPIAVPAALTSPHVLVARTLAVLRKASGITSNAASRDRVKPGQLRLVRDGC